MNEVKKGSELTIDIDDLAYGGEGVGRLNGFVVFVPGVVPGDRARVRVFKKSSNHAKARLLGFESRSPARIDPPCPIFDRCGGCTWQNLTYEDQLRWKHKQVSDTLKHLTGAPLPEIEPIVPSPGLWNYRNKMEYTFGRDDDGRLILGFHQPGRYDRIFEVPACLIHPAPFDILLTELTAWARENELEAHDQNTRGGFLRHAVMRHSRTTGGVVLMLLTRNGELPGAAALAERLKNACPEFQGMVWGTNDGLADVARPEKIRFTWGDPILKETLNGLTFNVSPQSFFQTNPAAAEKLYQAIVEMSEIGPGDRVLDAYCGTGSIALHFARAASRVVGIEIVREAVWNARENAHANGITNSTFLSSNIFEAMPLARQAAGGSFTRVIIDPPRGGMDKRSLRELIAARAPLFIYVSCNPSTLARDAVVIRDAGYVIDAVRPVDMFPHTWHIEVITRFRLPSQP